MRYVSLAICLLAAHCAAAQDPGAGRTLFEKRCAECHGADGNGGEFASGILSRVAGHSDAELSALIRSGVPGRGMPPFALSDSEMTALVTHLRALRPQRPAGAEPQRVKLPATSGETLEGIVTGEGIEDLQLRAGANRIHLLRRAGERFRPVTSQTDWPTYDGQYSGNRYTTLRQIDKGNVARLVPRWTFPMDDTTGLQTTPVVVEGVMYITSANQCFALDAGSGRQIWHFQVNHFWRASPMTYVFDRKQYVAVASGPNILAFALPD